MARNTKHRKGHKQKVAEYKLMVRQRRNSQRKKFLEAINSMYLDNIKNKENQLTTEETSNGI